MVDINQENFNKLSNAIRFLSVDAIEKSKSGHPGLPMGMADVVTVLFQKHLRFNPQDPHWPNRDRFILSAGHGSMLLYSLLYLTGYDLTIEDIKNFRQFGAKTAGHPEYNEPPGIETTTGPLGQGIANGVGMALGEAILHAKFPKLIDHKTYVLAGDGCLMEGISQEAISLAGHLNLKNLIVLFDSNGITIDGKVNITSSDDTRKRFESCGWNVLEVDGHDQAEIDAGLEKANAADKPTLVICTTTIGFGSPNKSGSEKAHGSPLGHEEATLTRKNLDWNHPPFEVPESILAEWRAIGKRCDSDYQNWKNTFEQDSDQKNLSAFLSKDLDPKIMSQFKDFKRSAIEKNEVMATRKSSQKVISDVLNDFPGLIGGSADLTGSNLTKGPSHQPIGRDKFDGNYVFYGIREHAMGAMMNGLSLYGLRAFGGTFLVFSDYARPAIRLSGLMKLPVVYVFTHDSIGLGEDGPTHQPVEHLSVLRAIPNLNVFRPCDSVETAEAWEIGLKSNSTPSILALSRQEVPMLRSDVDNKTEKGGYLLWSNQDNLDDKAPADLTIISSGTEVSLSLEIVKELSETNDFKNKKINVVSMPCIELFKNQSSEYRNQVIPMNGKKVVIEAGIRMSWDFLLNEKDHFFGVETFGLSAPAKEVYAHFGLTKENIISKIKI